MGKSIIEFLKMNEVEYHKDVLIKNISPVKIGGNASLVIFPNNISQLISAVDFLAKTKIEYIVVGKITNILFTDTNIRKIIVKTDKLQGYKISDDVLAVMAGESLARIAVKLAKLGYGGFSEFSGIPGSVGGLVYNNAGAFGRSVSDIIKSVTAYDSKSKNIIVFEKDELSFSYRKSLFRESGHIILAAHLNIEKGKPESFLSQIARFREQRIRTQPIGVPSLGSVFKRPGVFYASKLIDDAGLKGFTIGGAEVSKKHAGFIINKGSATYEDYTAVIAHVKSVIYEKYGVVLEEEIEII